MRRRWFGVFLTLFLSISFLLSAVPAYAYSECHWVDSDHILCDGSANFIKANGGSFAGSFLLNGQFSSGITNITNGNTQARLSQTANNIANITTITLGSPQNATAAPGSNTTPSAINCNWTNKDTINCGGLQYVQTSGSGQYILDANNRIGSVSADKLSATKVQITTNPTSSISTPVVLGQVANAAIDPAAATAAADVKPLTCDAGPGFTWIICGVIELMVKAVDDIEQGVIVPFLKEPPLNEKNPQFAQAHSIWSAFRNVASVFFILVFFLVIIGTALGFDNYTIKKVMPHLVAGAILVPFSWYFCAFIIDIGNTLGQGIIPLVNSTGLLVQIDLTSDWSKIFLSGVAGVGAFALFAGAATIGLGAVISVLLAFIGVFLTLILRKIFIILAVIISPFAVLAWILPNTSKWFDEWWKNFFKLVMMYPIIILLFEGGRIFSASAGATVNTIEWVTPLLQVMGLILPLFAVPFAFKFAGKGLAAGSKAVGKVTGSLDKRYGKDSDSAKMAAKNREIKNMQRGQALGDRAKTAMASGNKVDGMRLKAASRLSFRRAGHALPFNQKSTGFGSNPTAMIAHQDAYASAVGALAKVDSSTNIKKQGFEGETAAERLKTETKMAQDQKLDARAKRKGIAEGMAGRGDELTDYEKEEFQKTKEQSRRNLIEEGSEAKGFNSADAKMHPSVEKLAQRSEELGDAAERIKLGGIETDIVAMGDLDTEEMDNFEKNNPGKKITLQEAHEMRMQNLAHSSGIKAYNKMLDRDIDSKTTVEASKRATQAVIDRGEAAGKPVTSEQASKIRLQSAINAGVSKGVTSKLEGEQDDMTYNEMEQKAGGALTGLQIMEARRTNTMEDIGMTRSKQEAALATPVPISAQEVLDATTQNASKALSVKQGKVAGDALEYQTKVNQVLADPKNKGMSEADARSSVTRTLSQARFVEGREKAYLAAGTENAGTISVAGDITKALESETKTVLAEDSTAGRVRPIEAVRNDALARVAQRQLKPIEVQSAEDATNKREATLRQAVGTEKGIESRNDQEVEDIYTQEILSTAGNTLTPTLAREEAKTRIKTGGARLETIKITAAANVRTRNLEKAGEAAELKGKEEYTAKIAKASGTIKANEAAVVQSTVEAAANAATERAHEQKLNEDQTKVLVNAARKQAADDIESGAIKRVEQEQYAATAAFKATENKTIRAAGVEDASIAATNRAISDPTRLSEVAQLEVDTENASAQLAAKRGQEEAVWEKGRPGAPLNRSFATGKASAKRVGADKFLEERISQANQDEFQTYKSKKTTDTAGVDHYELAKDAAGNLIPTEKFIIEDAPTSDDVLTSIRDEGMSLIESGQEDRGVALLRKLGTIG